MTETYQIASLVLYTIVLFFAGVKVGESIQRKKG